MTDLIDYPSSATKSQPTIAMRTPLPQPNARGASGFLGCCQGYNSRLLFLTGCAMIEYISHVVMLIVSPMIVLHFYPTTALARVGFYTAILNGSGYLGHFLSCRVWINLAKSLRSGKGILLWGLAVIGAGNFGLLLCQSIWAMAIVRFAAGLFSCVVPIALIEIDNICGYETKSYSCSCDWKTRLSSL